MFDVRRLGPDDALSTYALARLDQPLLTLPEWREQLSQAPHEGGSFAAFTRQTPRALLSYVGSSSPAGVEFLIVKSLSAFDLTDPAHVALELIGAVYAQQHGTGQEVAWASGADIEGFLEAVARQASLHSVI